MLASLIDQLATIGTLVGLFVFAALVLGGTSLGRRTDSERQRRGDAYLRGDGDDD